MFGYKPLKLETQVAALDLLEDQAKNRMGSSTDYFSLLSHPVCKLTDCIKPLNMSVISSCLPINMSYYKFC